MLGNKQNVGLAVRRTQTDVARMPAHDLDDAYAAMALRRGADALHAGRSDINRGREARRDVINHLLEVKLRPRGQPLITMSGGRLGGLASKLVGLIAMV